MPATPGLPEPPQRLAGLKAVVAGSACHPHGAPGTATMVAPATPRENGCADMGWDAAIGAGTSICVAGTTADGDIPTAATDVAGAAAPWGGANKEAEGGDTMEAPGGSGGAKGPGASGSGAS
mmetsp:Transcript_42779/g.91177  ORF Transcript_42779/g.91177 Transcript_42779/m.91177 type:complete len:122 (-) Transcript_42779:253-618(-)